MTRWPLMIFLSITVPVVGAGQSSVRGLVPLLRTSWIRLSGTARLRKRCMVPSTVWTPRPAVRLCAPIAIARSIYRFGPHTAALDLVEAHFDSLAVVLLLALVDRDVIHPHRVLLRDRRGVGQAHGIAV